LSDWLVLAQRPRRRVARREALFARPIDALESALGDFLLPDFAPSAQSPEQDEDARSGDQRGQW